MAMLLTKTDVGMQAFKERHAQLAGKLRSAFLLFDGRRTVDDVLATTRGLGVTADDIEVLRQAGFLADAQPAAAAAEPAPEQIEVPSSHRTPQERYMQAYPLAVALTGKLGLSGFRLNLAVEAAGNYEELAALAPKIKSAVGQEKYAPLEQALFG